jgi:hypothetical protein|tara:strand:- start:283 stop:453 length:171 start_codon:yes stop_codon:yes gene_type:complete
MFAVINTEENLALGSHLTEQQADDWWDSIDSYCTNAGRINTCRVVEHGPDASFEYV